MFGLFSRSWVFPWTVSRQCTPHSPSVVESYRPHYHMFSVVRSHVCTVYTFCRAFPPACCGFRSELIVLLSVWPLNNIASSTGPQIQPMSYIPYIYLYSGTSLIRASCLPLSYISSTYLHLLRLTSSHSQSNLIPTKLRLVRWASYLLSFSSNTKLHVIYCYPPDLIRWASSHPLVSISFLWPVSRPQKYHLKTMVNLGYNTSCVQAVKFGAIFFGTPSKRLLCPKKICFMVRSDIGAGMIFKFVSESTTRLQVKVGLCIMLFFWSKVDGTLTVMSTPHMICYSLFLWKEVVPVPGIFLQIDLVFLCIFKAI